jgi:hypothetical protein
MATARVEGASRLARVTRPSRSDGEQAVRRVRNPEDGTVRGRNAEQLRSTERRRQLPREGRRGRRESQTSHRTEDAEGANKPRGRNRARCSPRRIRPGHEAGSLLPVEGLGDGRRAVPERAQWAALLVGRALKEA